MDVVDLIITPAFEAVNGCYDFLTCWITATFWVALPFVLLVSLVNVAGRRLLTQRARYALWSLVLILLLLPVSVVSSLSVQTAWSIVKLPKIQSGGLVESCLLSVGYQTKPASSGATPGDTQAPSARDQLSRILIPNLIASMKVILCAGSILMACITVVAFHRMFGWMRYGRDCSDQFCLEQVEAARRCYGVEGTVKLRTVHQLVCTAAFDWFWPTILVPENFANLPEAERKHIVSHEMARIKRGDSAMSLLFSAARILHWWNPLFWWTQSKWKLERELACDALTIRPFDYQQKQDYLAILQRAHAEPRKLPGILIDTPGFVLFSGSQRALDRRIHAISQSDRREGRLKNWFSWCAVCVLAVAGLTDAAKQPLQNTPIELPPGTEWEDAAEPEKTSDETKFRTYDITEYLARPEIRDSPESSALELAQRINGMLRPVAWNVTSISRYPTPVTVDEQRCRIEGQQLIVRATADQHDQIASLFARWTANTDTQVTIFFRHYRTKLQLADLFPSSRGKVINSNETDHEYISLIPIRNEAPSTSNAELSNESPLPIFMSNLTPDELKEFNLLAQRDSRISAISSRAVTLLDGRTCAALFPTERPFATGFIRIGAETEPKISTYQEGTSFKLFPLVQGDKILLRFVCLFSSITNVHTRTLKTDAHDFLIQVPIIRNIHMGFSALMGNGATQVLVPLERDADGQLTLILVTPKIIEETTVKDLNSNEKPTTNLDTDPK